MSVLWYVPVVFKNTQDTCVTSGHESFSTRTWFLLSSSAQLPLEDTKSKYLSYLCDARDTEHRVVGTSTQTNSYTSTLVSTKNTSMNSVPQVRDRNIFDHNDEHSPYYPCCIQTIYKALSMTWRRVPHPDDVALSRMIFLCCVYYPCHN